MEGVGLDAYESRCAARAFIYDAPTHVYEHPFLRCSAHR